MQFRSIVLFSTNKIKITHRKHSPTSQIIESVDIHMQVSAHAQSQARVHKHIYRVRYHLCHTSPVAPVVQLVTSKPSDVGTLVRISVSSHELGFFLTHKKKAQQVIGERLNR